MRSRALAGAALLGLAACGAGASPEAAVAIPPSASAVAEVRCAIEGVVKSARDEPVDGALVAVVLAPDDAEPAIAATATSKGGGRFCVAEVAPGKYAITATAPGHTGAYVEVFPVEAGKPSRGLVVKLGGESVTIRGTIFDARKSPAASATVHAIRISNVSGDVFLARTGPDGAYEITVPRADYVVHAEAPGHESERGSVSGAKDPRLDLTLARTFDPQKPAPDEVVRWIAKEAIPLQSVEVGHGFADLQKIRDIVGKARIVSLGEATHGTREFFQLKHRMLEFLVSEMGFDVFGIEASFPEALTVNEYVLTGKGDPALALTGMRFWTWDTEEVLDLIRWVRRYNEDPSHPKKVRFHGFDMQFPPGSVGPLIDYLHKVDRPFSDEARRALTPLDDDFTTYLWPRLPASLTADARAGIAAVVKRLDERKDAFVARSSRAEWAMARLHAAVVHQGEEWLRLGDRGYEIRDRAMAENARALLDLEGPASKIVLWAHNAHVARQTLNGVKPMGAWLHEAVGAEQVVFGFAFNQGSFQSNELPYGAGRGIIDFTVPPAPPGSLDAALARAGAPILALDLRQAPPGSAAAEWLGAHLRTRSIGGGYTDAHAARFLRPEVPSASYDALLFVEKTSAARGNPIWKKKPRASTAATPPGVLTNGAMEEGKAGEAPPGWFGAKAGSPYRVSLISERPASGKRCASIQRDRAGSPPSSGHLMQLVDAAPYRGKRVRLRASVRAEVSGVGNDAMLVLAALEGPGSGLENALALTGTFDRPIIAKEWRPYSVELVVPKETGTLDLGLVLAGHGRAYLDDVVLEILPDR